MRVKLYYTTRELSSAAPEFWALRSLGSEAIIPGARGGHPWLQEHVRAGYHAAWHERLSDGSIDASVSTAAYASRLDSYWLEGIAHLIRTTGIDGIYLDGAPYERRTLHRLRRLADALHPSFELDLHASCAANPRLPYIELLPILDSIWFGEQCEYREMAPDQWLADVSGVPFGVPAEVLTDEGARWAALVFGMTCRIYPEPQRCEPRPLWQALERIGAGESALVGFWDAKPLVAVRARAAITAAAGHEPAQGEPGDGAQLRLDGSPAGGTSGGTRSVPASGAEPLVKASIYLGGAWRDAAVEAARVHAALAANASAPPEDAARGRDALLAAAARLHWRRAAAATGASGDGAADAAGVLPLPIALAVASWEARHTAAALLVDWAALGLCARGARLVAPAIRRFQGEAEWADGAALEFGAQRSGEGEGYLLQLHAARAGGTGCGNAERGKPIGRRAAAEGVRPTAEASEPLDIGRLEPPATAERDLAGRDLGNRGARALGAGRSAQESPAPSARERTVWQLADVHLQQSYAEGAPIFGRCLPAASAPHAADAPAERGGGSSVGGNGPSHRPFGAAGLFGDDYCDSPPRLLDAVLAHINATHAASAERALRPLVLLSGDWVMSGAGGRSPVSDDAVLAAPAAVAAALALRLPGARAYPLWGNHDLLPYNTHTGGANGASAAVAHAFAPWVGEAAARELAGRGYYALSLDADLGVPTPAAGSAARARAATGQPALAGDVRLLALNTALFSPSNSAAHSAAGHAAARAQLRWLGSQLRELAAARGSALIVGHEPPGADWYTCRARHSPVASWWIPEHAREYAALVSRFRAAVALQTFGHTHADELRIVTPTGGDGAAGGDEELLAGADDDGEGGGGLRGPVGPGDAARAPLEPTVAFVAPPLTPYGSAFNPAVRAYSLELRARAPDEGGVAVLRAHAGAGDAVVPSGCALLRDFTQWVLLLESSNLLRRPVWKVEYTAARAYGLTDMSVQSWRDALARMREPRSIELARYVAHTNVWDQGRERFHTIDGARAMLCGAEHVDPDAFARCRDDAASAAAGAPPRARHGDVLPSAASLEVEGVSAVWATLPRGVTATG